MLFYHVEKPDLMLPAITDCIAFLKRKTDLSPGKQEDIGNGIRCTISSYETVEEDQAFWEAHKCYIDVHYVIEGQERVSVCSLAEAEIGSYHPERDYLEVTGIPTIDIKATAGTVLCLFPNDVHRTRVQISSIKSNRIMKAIFKIPVELMSGQ